MGKKKKIVIGGTCFNANCQDCNIRLEHVQGQYWRCPNCFILYEQKKESENKDEKSK